MKKIIFSVILLILFVLVFRNKIEFFNTYPDNAMKNHDKWINDTVNYVTNERNEIAKCLELIKQILYNENLPQFIQNVQDNYENPTVASVNLLINKIRHLLPNVSLNNRRLLNILERYLTCNINHYRLVNNLYTHSPTTQASISVPASTTSQASISVPASTTTQASISVPASTTSQALPTSATSMPTEATSSATIEQFTSHNSHNVCESLIDTVEEERKFDNKTGRLINVRKPLFIELISNYLMNQDVFSVIDVLYNIYEEKYIKHLPQYNNNMQKLPCLIYDKSSCPIDRCQLSTIDSDNSICHPKYVDNVPLDISARVDSCSVVTPYGEKYCESTKDKNGNSCVFDNVRNKCVKENERNTPVQCHEVNSNSATNFEQKCNSLENPDGSQKCTYKGITHNGKTHNFCYDKNNENNSSNLCYAFSGLKRNEIPGELNCNILNVKNDYYSIPSDINAFEHDNNDLCHLFDNSDTMEDNIPKNLDQKLNIDSIQLQKKLCEGLIDRNGNPRCKFIEHNTFVSNTQNDQKVKNTLTKCIKNNVTVDASYIKGNQDNYEIKKIECLQNPDNIWSEENLMCINKNSKCDTIKHEKLCNYKQNCHWTSIGPYNINPDDNFERGYCNDVKSKELERIIDIVHRKEIDKLVKIDELKNQISIFNKKIKSQDILNQLQNTQ